MIVETRIFELCNGKYKNLSELAKTMGISVSQIYRVREGTRSIHQKFIVGAVKAFPEHKFDDLFYFALEPAARKQLKMEGARIKEACQRSKQVSKTNTRSFRQLALAQKSR